LKFTLEGVKLKGSWVLVKTKGRGGARMGERGWLLIKHRDEWAGEIDITEFAPLSIKSFGDFADILTDDDLKTWQSHAPAKGGAAGEMLRQILDKVARRRSGAS
jgi:bifunctional non-homologous end joining protein LigD